MTSIHHILDMFFPIHFFLSRFSPKQKNNPYFMIFFHVIPSVIRVNRKAAPTEREKEREIEENLPWGHQKWHLHQQPTFRDTCALFYTFVTTRALFYHSVPTPVRCCVALSSHPCADVSLCYQYHTCALLCCSVPTPVRCSIAL